MRLLAALLILTLAACGRGVPENARIVVAGDSVMAWNRAGGGSVADRLGALLDEPVGDVSLPYASITGSTGPGALSIARQTSALSPDWVVMNGGANDLRAGCGCNDCGAVLDRLISADGRTGAIPGIVAELRAKGTKVLWADYYTSPIYAGTACTAPYDTLKARVSRLAAADPGVELVEMGGVMPSGDASLFAPDRLHPSREGSARIARLVADRLARRP